MHATSYKIKMDRVTFFSILYIYAMLCYGRQCVTEKQASHVPESFELNNSFKNIVIVLVLLDYLYSLIFFVERTILLCFETSYAITNF